MNSTKETRPARLQIKLECVRNEVWQFSQSEWPSLRRSIFIRLEQVAKARREGRIDSAFATLGDARFYAEDARKAGRIPE